jgi:hypothetical protein
VVGWAKLCTDREPLPSTVCQRTGSGGYHGLYRIPLGAALRSKLAQGVDVPTSHIVVPPSMHSCGERYAWIRSPWEYEIAEATPWLVELARVGGGGGASSFGHAGPQEGAPPTRASIAADASPSGADWRMALAMARRGAIEGEIADALRSGASYASRQHDRGERYVVHTARKALALVASTPAPDPWAGSIRGRVVRAKYDPLDPAPWKGQPHTLHQVRWRLDGVPPEQRRQFTTIPVGAYDTERTRVAYAAVLPDIEPTAWLEPGGWRLERGLAGLVLELVFQPGEKRAKRMRRVG